MTSEKTGSPFNPERPPLLETGVVLGPPLELKPCRTLPAADSAKKLLHGSAVGYIFPPIHRQYPPETLPVGTHGVKVRVSIRVRARVRTY